MTTIQIRIDDNDKKTAEEILKAIGMDIPTAIRAFLKKVKQVRGIPFPLTADSKLDENGFTKEQVAAILQAEKEAERGVNVFGPFNTAEEMIESLES